MNLHLNRDVLVDGTLYSMGKSAGNAPLELLAMYMNAQFGKQYDVNQIQGSYFHQHFGSVSQKAMGIYPVFTTLRLPTAATRIMSLT